MSDMDDMDADNPYLDLRRHCACSGVALTPEQAQGLGTWCGRLATQEDGQCDHCRRDCERAKGPIKLLTVDEVVMRDTPWLERNAELKGAGQ